VSSLSPSVSRLILILQLPRILAAPPPRVSAALPIFQPYIHSIGSRIPSVHTGGASPSHSENYSEISSYLSHTHHASLALDVVLPMAVLAALSPNCVVSFQTQEDQINCSKIQVFLAVPIVLIFTQFPNCFAQLLTL
jgi:hypothetical protein